MQYITKTEDGYDLVNYLNYLDSIREKLPLKSREFAFYPGHYEIESKRCLHDCWVEEVDIQEIGSGERNATRLIQISVNLLGAYHDGYHQLVYKNVHNYNLALSQTKKGISKIGHGDWIIDELTISSDGAVSHEIEFSQSGKWLIHFTDIHYNWISKST